MAHTRQLSKRAYTYIAIFFIMMLALSVIASCGNDDIVNNGGNNNEIFLYSIDSFKIFMPNGQLANDTVLNIANSNQVKITFDCVSNTDSVNSWALFKLSGEYIDTNNVIHTYIDSTYNIISGLNNSFTFYINSISDYGLKIYLQLQRNPPAECFIKLENIKVLRIN